MSGNCRDCPAHKAMLDLHATAKMVAGRAYPRGRPPAPSTLARDDLRRAVEAFEAASAEVLGLAFGVPDGEDPA